MQKVSKAYKEAMKNPLRNRGYIRSTIGIINSDAQNNARVLESENNFAYFSDLKKPFNGYEVDRIYAMPEQDFSKVDGSMYFLPLESSGFEYYNNGLVSGVLLGSIRIDFSGESGLDIKGLTIDFGEYYPTEFTVEWDHGAKEYQNNLARFVTEDVFEGVSYFVITAKTMVNGAGRLRIYDFICGIAKTFTNNQVRSYSFKDVVSPITESIPSQDMTLEVDNQDLYYSVDNPESALAFFEIGQEIRTAFGYDITGQGDIEWLAENTCYLKTWTADDVKAKFTATDRFDYLTGTYYRGKYYTDGISLYDLAIDVLNDAGITDEREYYIDPYLKKIIVYNPIPAVKHSEALQIIANAGRCVLYQDRKKRIRMKASFVPELAVSANNQEEFSSLKNLIKNTEKAAYAIFSNDFSVVDGSLLFMPSDGNYKETGYVSKSISDESGDFTENPIITIIPEAAFYVNGLLLKFRNVAPKRYTITTFLEDQELSKIIVDEPDVESLVMEEFEPFDKMEIEFTKGHPDAKITLDNILINDVTDYTLSRKYDISGNPTGERKSKLKTLSVERKVYSEPEETKDLKTDKITLTEETEQRTIYFTNPSFDYVASLEVDGVTAEIVDQSSYMITVEFTRNSDVSDEIEFKIMGKEYVVSDSLYEVKYNEHGEEITWGNPLISTEELARDLEEWLASYYLGDVEYSVSWRGDPRIDAGDLMYLELKDREAALIKADESSLKFSGAWSGTIKGRKAVVSWR